MLHLAAPEAPVCSSLAAVVSWCSVANILEMAHHLCKFSLNVWISPCSTAVPTPSNVSLYCMAQYPSHKGNIALHAHHFYHMRSLLPPNSLLAPTHPCCKNLLHCTGGGSHTAINFLIPHATTSLTTDATTVLTRIPRAAPLRLQHISAGLALVYLFACYCMISQRARLHSTEMQSVCIRTPSSMRSQSCGNVLARPILQSYWHERKTSSMM